MMSVSYTHLDVYKRQAIDIESKLTEAALANSLLADFRNFGHGRHHWFDKKRKNSAIIALVSPEEKELADKTIAQLPKDIPVLQLTTTKTGAAATIEPVSYTHLDVYKRQPLARSLTICFTLLMIIVFPAINAVFR